MSDTLTSLAADAERIAEALAKWNQGPDESLVIATLTRRTRELADGIRALESPAATRHNHVTRDIKPSGVCPAMTTGDS